MEMVLITSSWVIEIKIFPPSDARLFILIYACDVKEARKGIPCCSIFDLVERQAGIKRIQSCKWRKKPLETVRRVENLYKFIRRWLKRLKEDKFEELWGVACCGKEERV